MPDSSKPARKHRKRLTLTSAEAVANQDSPYAATAPLTWAQRLQRVFVIDKVN